MKKWTIGLVILALISGVGWYLVSPAYAMMQLKDAAQEGDADELDRRVDFASVRSELKVDMKAQMAAKIAEESGNGLAALGGMLAMGMVDNMVDGFINAQAVSRLIENGKMKKSDDATTGQTRETDWAIERHGLDSFRAYPEDAGENPPTMIFTRDGLGWRLTKLDIPMDGLARSQ